MTKPLGPCIIWHGKPNASGYGRTTHGKLAHRAAWEKAHPGETPPPVVRHRCDNPPCVNPDHLVAGTHQDNSDDMQSRGRHRYAEDHHRAKLTDAEVEEIRKRAGTSTRAALGLEFAVHPSTITLIIQGKRRQAAAGTLGKVENV